MRTSVPVTISAFKGEYSAKTGGHLDGPQIDVETECFTKSQDSLFRPQGRFDVVPLIAADGAKEDSVSVFSRFHRFLRKRRATGVVSRTAGHLSFKGQAYLADLIYFLQHLYGAGRNFFPDAVAGDDDDVFTHEPLPP